MSVFNPTLSAEVRFDQPVQQPDVFGAVGGLLQGLGVIQTGTPREPSDNERFDATVRQFQSVSGNTRPIAEWTPSDFRSFERMAGPRFGAQAVQLAETSGGAGFVQQRDAVDVLSTWRNSAPGVMAGGESARLYPDDPQAQEAYVIQSFANQQQSIARLEQLQRQSQTGEAIQGINDDVWDTQRDQISQMAFSASNVLAELYPRLAAGEAINLSDVSPEVVAVLGYSPTINQNNIGLVSQQIRRALFDQYTSQMRTLLPGQDIRRPNEDYMNDVFAPFDDVVAQIISGVDPTELLQRESDSDRRQLRQRFIDAGMPHAISSFELARGIDPRLQQQLLSQNWESITGILMGSDVASPSSASDMSSRERSGFQEVFTTELQAVSASPITQMGRAEAFVNRLESFIQVQTASGDRLSPSHYRSIVSPNVLASIQASGEDPAPMITSLIQSDIGLEISDLRDIVTQREGGLVYEGGQLRYIPSTLISDTGQTLGERRLDSTEQGLLDRLNGKLSILNSGGSGVPQGLVDSLMSDITIEPRLQSGPGASQTTSQQALSRDELVAGITASLTTTESSGNYMARNSIEGSGGTGHFGLLQFSRGRLAEAIASGVMPVGMTPEQFLRDPETQRRVGDWHINDIIDRINEGGLTQYLGQQIGGVTVTMEGLVAAAHLGGFEGMRRFVESGGEYNPSDAYGTSLLDYLGRHGEGGTTAVPSGGASLSTLHSDILRRIITPERGSNSFGGEGSVVLQRPSEGATEASRVEQAPVSTTTPEQGSAGRTEAGRTTSDQMPVNPEIVSLINTLTNRGVTEEEIRAYLEAIRNE